MCYTEKYCLLYLIGDVCVVSWCQTVVKVLSPDDGKLSIVRAAQQLCKAVEQKESTSKDINVTLLDSLLRGKSSLQFQRSVSGSDTSTSPGEKYQALP